MAAAPVAAGGGPSQECLVTLVMKVDLGGWLSQGSLVRRLGAPLSEALLRAWLEPMLLSVVMLRDKASCRGLYTSCAQPPLRNLQRLSLEQRSASFRLCWCSAPLRSGRSPFILRDSSTRGQLDSAGCLALPPWLWRRWSRAALWYGPTRWAMRWRMRRRRRGQRRRKPPQPRRAKWPGQRRAAHSGPSSAQAGPHCLAAQRGLVTHW